MVVLRRRDQAIVVGSAHAPLRAAKVVEQRLGRTLASYGLLVEDLDLYRSLVSSAPLCRTGPRSLAAAGLRESAKLVFERARKAQVS